MNKAITEGLVFTPPQFERGLDVWSSGDGRPGSETYASDPNATLVLDAGLGDALQLSLTGSPTKLRYMGETPILPGCYLRISTRVRATSGTLPAKVRVAGWAGDAGGAHVEGLVETGPETVITNFSDEFEISAIVGTGARTGVDMVWGTVPVFGHFGIDITDSSDLTIRIADIKIEDVSALFLRDLVGTIDVRDFGAIGDGTTDNTAAFEAANAASAGRRILVPGGTYFLADHVTFDNEVVFQGTVTMPGDKRLTLTKNFDLPSYINAFGDELTAFKKAVQALFNFSDHESLDMGGRQIEVPGPIDIHAAVGNRDTHNIRTVIRNGELTAVESAAWADDIVTSQATYSPTSSLQLTGVANIANVPVGARVTGSGVGREVYVRDVNIGAQTLTLSQPLFDAAGTQVFTFTNHKYLLDFRGFSHLSRLVLDNVDLKCNGFANGLMLPPSGLIIHVRDCFFTRPKDRAITSIGDGCQGLLVDRCQFISNEQQERAQDRRSIAININSNDTKIRDNRAVRFAHFAVMGGSGHMIQGNHWFQGDNETNGLRTAGIVLTNSNAKTAIVGNYVDNSSIEWTNEHDSDPIFANELSFGGLSITGNIFTVSDAASWFSWIVLKPYGAGHFLNGFSVTGNTFKSINGNIDRADALDTSFAGLDFGRVRNIAWHGNSYHGVENRTVNPVMIDHSVATDAQTWRVDLSAHLPFGGWARRVESLVADGPVTKIDGGTVSAMPYVQTQVGTENSEVDIVWPEPCSGKVWITARVDNPT